VFKLGVGNDLGSYDILEVVPFRGSKVGKAYEVQTWYTDGAQRPVSATSAVTSKVKGQGHVTRLTGVGR